MENDMSEHHGIKNELANCRDKISFQQLQLTSLTVDIDKLNASNASPREETKMLKKSIGEREDAAASRMSEVGNLLEKQISQ
mmetsp:Transcript_64257/g.76078  ORF Transcript_64257/g.76078 Transcript_64257/m.76078 type:complete len:82 (+) Transcript_64257:1111-1356(+)